MIFLRQNHNNQNVIRCHTTRAGIASGHPQSGSLHSSGAASTGPGAASALATINSRPVARPTPLSGAASSSATSPNPMLLVVPTVGSPTSATSASLNYAHPHRASLNSALSGDFVRTLSMNEKLASIGGLFGILSILVTAVLLYAIFTTKSQAYKWYYVVAVVVNVSLLVVLMACAILVDRFYLKKYIFTSNQIIDMTTPRTPNGTYRRANNNTPSPGFPPVPSSSGGRVIHVVPTLYGPPPRSGGGGGTDLPPEYPGVLGHSTNPSGTVLTINAAPKSNRAVVVSVKPATTTIHTTTRQKPKTPTNSLNSSSETSQAANEEPVSNEAEKLKSTSQPPNYFDLYPAPASSRRSSGVAHSSQQQSQQQQVPVSNIVITFSGVDSSEPTVGLLR